MRIRGHGDTATAILLVGVVVLCAWWIDRPQRAALPAVVPQWLPAQGSVARERFEWCRENVAIVHDVYWASACKVLADQGGSGLELVDDSPDCTLPDDRARLLNEARARAEQQCLEEARVVEN